MLREVDLPMSHDTMYETVATDNFHKLNGTLYISLNYNANRILMRPLTILLKMLTTCNMVDEKMHKRKAINPLRAHDI